MRSHDSNPWFKKPGGRYGCSTVRVLLRSGGGVSERMEGERGEAKVAGGRKAWPVKRFCVQQWVRGLMHGLFGAALGDVGP